MMRVHPSSLDRTAASALALAMASLATPAAAQSYAAPDPTVVSGIVNFDRTVPGQETYTINSSTAVIDFVPNDTGAGGGAIIFQPAGTTATYQNGTGTSDFTILNRIVPVDPSRPVQFDGTVISQLLAGGPPTPGGAVWFYSPGGVIVGPTGVFDVGSLLLTTGDPTGGTGTIGSPASFTVNSAPDSGAAVQVMPGGQITASPDNSYIALVAPTVIQQGTVSSNGGVAYVAAEQATLSFSNGLIDIQTTVGSNGNFNQPLVHEGTTRFINDTGQRVAYLVAVPKNDAITMVIGGTSQLGFDTASGVAIDNGTVVLTGDYDISGSSATYRNSGLATNVLVLGGTFNANTQIRSASGAFVQSDSAISFAGDLDILGQQVSSVLTSNGDISIAGNLTATSVDAAGQGGTVLLASAGTGRITVGSANLVATSSALDPTQDITGGSVSIVASESGSVAISGDLNVDVSASGGFLTSGTGGTTSGGTVSLIAVDGRPITVAGTTTIFADGVGAQAAGTGVTAGAGAGGSVTFNAIDGQISLAGATTIYANGSGGNLTSGTGQAGLGSGGALSIFVDGATSSVDFAGLGVEIRASGGDAIGTSVTGDAGAGTGGSVGLFVSPNGGTIDFDAIGITADVTGGLSTTGNGGAASGAVMSVLAQGGTIRAASGFTVSANASGGAGLNGSASSASGGSAQFQADGGALEFSQLSVDSNAAASTSFANYDGGDATGGLIGLSASNGGSVVIADVDLSANAAAGDSTAGDGTAGSAFGGVVNLAAVGNGTLDIGQATLTADALGGSGLVSGFAGGSGTAGSVSLSQDTGGALTVQNAVLSANGAGGSTIGGSGVGGTGSGGHVSIVAHDGPLVVTGDLFASATGSGGSGSATGGTGTGGLASLGALAGTVRVDGDASLTANAAGGSSSGTGGLAEGGVAQITTEDFLGGSVIVGGTGSLSAEATGGVGSGGAEGASARGAAQALVRGGSITLDNLFLSDSGAQPNSSDEVSQIRAEQGSLLVNNTLDANVAGDFLLIGAGTAGFIETNDLMINAGNTVFLDDPAAPGTAGPDNLTINNDVVANLGGDLVLPVPVEIAGSFTVNAGGSITTGQVLAGGGISLAAQGDLTTGELGTFGDIAVETPGTATIGGIAQGVNLFALADGGVAFSGDATLTGQAYISTQGTATFDGVVAGATMVIQSSDIEIGSSGGLGAAGTSSLSFEAFDSAGRVAFGGDDSAAGYSLGGDEAARLRANTIFFAAASTAEATLTVGTFTLQGSASSNPNLLGSELILFGDRIRVVGDAQIANAGAGDLLALSTDSTLGGGPIEVVTDLGGRLRVLAPDGSPTGSLLLDASDIWVGRSDLLDRLAVDVNFAGLEDAVAAPDGTDRAEGNVIAGIIHADGLNSIIIQNSHTASLRGGFTAGNHFFIDTQATAPGSVVVAVNGRIGDGAGGFFTNEATRDAIDFVDPAVAELLAPESTVNGCLLTGEPCSFVDGPGYESEPNIAADVREIAEMVEEDHETASEEEEEREQGERAAQAAPSETTKKSPIVRPVTIVDTSPLTAEPTIDEPVAGTQNPNFRLDPSSAAGASESAGDQ